MSLSKRSDSVSSTSAMLPFFSPDGRLSSGSLCTGWNVELLVPCAASLFSGISEKRGTEIEGNWTLPQFNFSSMSRNDATSVENLCELGLVKSNISVTFWRDCQYLLFKKTLKWNQLLESGKTNISINSRT